MRFQSRDAEILQAIYENEGILARRHLKALFWPDKNWRAMEQRLAKLCQAGFISWPSKEQYKIYPIPEAICWLGWQGALYIAGTTGIKVDPPSGDNEYKLRLLESKLRKNGFRWVREPRWSMLSHDLTVVDFRLALRNSLNQLTQYTLSKWLSESVFRSEPDVITYTIKTTVGKSFTSKKGVLPDAYFEIIDEARRVYGDPPKARFLLEIDMGTHDNLSFGRDKVVPGVAYIRSEAYKTRFGSNSGRWLVVANGGSRRLDNLMKQTEEKVGEYAKTFLFTTLEHMLEGNLLVSSIWWQPGQTSPIKLLG
jgi:hypothetical protein